GGSRCSSRASSFRVPSRTAWRYDPAERQPCRDLRRRGQALPNHSGVYRPPACAGRDTSIETANLAVAAVGFQGNAHRTRGGNDMTERVMEYNVIVPTFADSG